VEAAGRLLSGFPAGLSARAERSLAKLGVTTLLGHAVVDITAAGVDTRAGQGGVSHTAAHTVIWAAGVAASPLATTLAKAAGTATDRAGRITVQPDLTIAGHPEVFAIGDMVRVTGPDGQLLALPGVAPVAMQQGRHAARSICDRLAGRQARPFRYVDKGNLATIGRSQAVADVKGLHLSGFPAWVTWLVVHLFYLIGFQNRMLVLLRWTFSFFTRGRGARTIIDGTAGDQ
jgi:NADH dehydrogenase